MNRSRVRTGTNVSANTANRAALLEAPWARGLTPELQRRVVVETVFRVFAKDECVCRKGDPADHWIGVMSGLIKIYSVSRQGKTTTFIGVPTGGWFGEGALLKNERRLYDGVALRASTVAYMPRNTFQLLLESSVAFNRSLIVQLNERLGQFVAMVEHDRLLGPEARLAGQLAALFNPLLYPGSRAQLPITQEELAHLVGLSRQTINQALKRLAAAGLLTVSYGSVTILDLDGLRRLEL
jgi:CRP-like cAMP-binding protein